MRRFQSAHFLAPVEQHFLTNPEKLSALVVAAQIGPSDRVLELGSGGGTVAAALLPCTLTLVELDRQLAESLRARFPNASVVSGDALLALEHLKADIILSNLPYALTHDVLGRLARKSFRRAVVAVREDDDIDALRAEFGLQLEPLVTLYEHDFTPPQPFPSKLLLVTHR